MKSRSWKKEYIVINHHDYDNTWTVITKSLTVKQAYNFIVLGGYQHRFNKDLMKIVTLADWSEVKGTASV